MAGTSWLIDGKRIATKIKSASETCDPKRIKWKSNPERACPSCNHVIDNSDVIQEWPGLPRGVKFDPSDQELLWHLLAKVGVGGVKPHPFIDVFIPTVDKDDGICYTHPRNLPGVQQDGNVSHFFHTTMRAYNTGTRKRRKIQSSEDVRWHKTGKTKPVIIDGAQKGCKKIMVLYMSMERGGKPEKTNWVMHQYHLGTGEDEKDGEFVVSKVFYQQQSKLSDKNEQDLPLDMPEALAPDVPDKNEQDLPLDMPEALAPDVPEALPPDMLETTIPKVDPVNPKSVTPEPPCSGMQQSDPGLGHELTYMCDELFAEIPEKEYCDTGHEKNNAQHEWEEKHDDHEIDPVEDPKWWEGESQFLLDSQQLVEGLSLCDELLQSQSSCGEGEPKKNRPRLSDYARIGVEDLKKDLEECQKLSQFDHTNIEFDTPADFRLSQLEFGSQDSFLAWAESKIGD